MTLKTGTTLALISFGVTLAYYVSNRLSPDALNLAIGVLCGIAASLPVSLGLLVALTRPREAPDEDPPREYAHPTSAPSAARAQMPQVIVLAPTQGGFPPGSLPYSFPALGSSRYPSYSPGQSEDVIEGRDWRIIGADE